MSICKMRKSYRTPDLPDETPVLINRFIKRLNELKESEMTEQEFTIKAGETYDLCFPEDDEIHQWTPMIKNTGGYWQGCREGADGLISLLQFDDSGMDKDGRCFLRPSKPRHKVVEWVAENPDKRDIVISDGMLCIEQHRYKRTWMTIAKIPYGQLDFYEGEGLDT